MKRISEEELDEAFDSDFGEISFDHEPTAQDIFLIKLGLVAQAQLEADEKVVREIFEGLENLEFWKDFGWTIEGEEYQALKEKFVKPVNRDKEK